MLRGCGSASRQVQKVNRDWPSSSDSRMYDAALTASSFRLYIRSVIEVLGAHSDTRRRSCNTRRIGLCDRAVSCFFNWLAIVQVSRGRKAVQYPGVCFPFEGYDFAALLRCKLQVAALMEIYTNSVALTVSHVLSDYSVLVASTRWPFIWRT